FFFFFQAEDGIRDRTVTGVQTCALPISLHEPVTSVGVGLAPFTDTSTRIGAIVRMFDGIRRGMRTRRTSLGTMTLANCSVHRNRSEERRVGKGGRVRGSADGEKRM